MKLGIVILAAGKGTRMRSALPKVLHPLAGRPLIRHVIDAAHALGAVQICCVYGHGGELVPTTLAAAGCIWVEQTERLGTGHAVLQAMPALAAMNRVLILYGDVPLIEPETLNRLVADSAHTALGVLTLRLPDPTGYGRIVRDKHGRVLRIVEQKDASEAELEINEVNTGIIVADRRALNDWLHQIDNKNAQGEYYLTDVIGIATAAGVQVATTAPEMPEEVAGVNDRLQLAQLERYHQRRLAESLLLGGTSIADPARIDIRGELICERDVTLDVNLICEGRVRLGANVRVGPNCVLKDCDIGADTEILANCLIEGAKIGVGARIGPFARLRPDADIGDRCHIGNFVEVKKSRVAEASKINHLSYIGDTDIGSHVNVGAGTITCNYDGVNKHRTAIGDRAFIGSNTALVAPVDVGAGATIGAGSVITRAAPADQLTLTRAAQVTIEGWQRPVKLKPTPPDSQD
ncbi:bifunctional UDP-N-acetylglucosamine diphosphorylase/glucosamine-1-phosphate N-acetyltransferase GlmU [Rhodopseudomonas palustris]|uniref:Bifunctional protein GlmU n=1 Tax=Thiospirillum jenense TaxID=1653858 RepID=A0A839HGR6_9GAMM|nr:bifunctional UDP-N-acetylglucosamine diphosphorylase/glucosamine-1-phosphate N-acetyltransferase GlmU [Thiospirillum jenense]MBB1091984.1 bifunctional UDP-N-acetylglucosamine diphosphorylase/glucosamine-1-phosphate N-acetyltransferase GlmU [Rhodopseudomonas palustris]MBB1126298.1 bifunctional UDP-N-acetylglucosamine diphosphorylase/glucosamine-1-phosphate N-acetyltransferase GlmU [Thiospirillum jenense]